MRRAQDIAIILFAAATLALWMAKDSFGAARAPRGGVFILSPAAAGAGFPPVSAPASIPGVVPLPRPSERITRSNLAGFGRPFYSVRP